MDIEEIMAADFNCELEDGSPGLVSGTSLTIRQRQRRVLAREISGCACSEWTVVHELCSNAVIACAWRGGPSAPE